MIYTNHITGVNVYDLEQGTDEWRRHRAGVITASRAHDILTGWQRPALPDDLKIEPTDKRGVNVVTFEGKEFRGTKQQCIDFVREQLPPKQSEARRGYMLELIAQVCTGLVPEQSSFRQAEWGHENEPLAREAYEAMEFVSVNQCGLIYRDNSLRCAISPDGIMEDRGLEIKNPYTTQVHLQTLMNGEIKPEYVTQCQFSMWLTGLERWDFCSYDHRMRGKASNRLCVIPQRRDDETMRKFDIEIPKFIEEMDEALSRLGFKFGQQWEI